MPRSKNIEDYFSAELSTLRANEPVEFDVHLYFSQNQHILLWKGNGDLLAAEFRKKYLDRGIHTIWIHNDDAERYKRYLNPSAPEPENEKTQGNAAPTVAEIGEEIQEKIQAAIELAASSPAEASPSETEENTQSAPQAEPEAVENARKEVAEKAQELLRRSVEPDTHRAQATVTRELRQTVGKMLEGMLDSTQEKARSQISELWKLGTTDPDLEHAVNVSTFAVIFAMAFGRIDTTLLADLALAGLLHDAGLSQLPAHIVSIPWRTMSADQLQTYATHVEEGLALISELTQDLPPRVMTIISQHHEKFDGSGYPKGLNGFKVDDMAQLLSMADILDSFASGQWDGTKRTLQSTFQMIEKLEKARTFPEYFNPEVFAAVIQWIRGTSASQAGEGALALVKDQTQALLKHSG